MRIVPLLRAVVLSVAATAAVAAASGAAIAVMVARRVVVPPRGPREDVRILSVDARQRRVVLAGGRDLAADGEYSLWFAGGTGHARIGTVTRERTDGVERELLDVDSGDLASARTARMNGWLHRHPRDLSLASEDVLVATPVGPALAWLVPAGSGEEWAVLVHGRGSSRREMLRSVPVLHGAGISCLVVSYRNDGEGPWSPDRRHGLGATEWADVDAAIAFATARGARRVLLHGTSMGGAIVLQTAARTTSDLVTGLILDSPVISWSDVLEHQGDLLRLVRPIRRAVLAFLTARWGRIVTGLAQPLDLATLDFVLRAGELRLPMLVLHSDDDAFVPSSGSRAVAAARPDLVRLVVFTGAGHARLRNVDPARWDGAVRAWLAGDEGALDAVAGETPPQPAGRSTR